MGALYTICLVLATLWCWKLYTNWRQLSYVPGPPLAGFSDFWRAWYQRRGELRGKLIESHKRYGPIVRYGVHSVSLNDPKMIDIVYGSRAGFVVADSYKVIVGISHGREIDSVITIADEHRHNVLRRSVASAFSAHTALDYEPHIDRTINELLMALSKERTLDLCQKMAFFGLDAASGFVFNSPKGCLAANADAAGMITVTRERMRHWSQWASIPVTERLLFRNPIALWMRRVPQSGIVSAALFKLNERTNKQKKQPQEHSETPDLLTHFLDAMERNPETLDQAGVVSLLMSMIAAASDTSANVLTATMFYLMKNPRTLSKLQEELDAGNVSRPIPAISQVNKLPYLHAVIREGLRLFPVLSHPIERLVPAGGVDIAGTFLPQGTSVGCLQLAIHLNTNAFGIDANIFRPERWLETSAEQLRIMEAAHLGFGRGRRVCIGQHIAMMEMKKAISAMILSFDISLKDPAAQLDADFSLGVACPTSLLVDMKPKE